ncbi:MAG: YraN family protein [Candidatus Moraniibacteriota bacterium]
MLNIFKKPTLSLGQLGEKAAAIYLKRLGYKILCTNFTNPAGRRLGEIDLITKNNEELVFVEVKTRKNNFNQVILPEENITSQKLYKLKKIVSYYLQTNNLWNQTYRFDAVTVLYNENTKIFKIKHLKNIFL